MIWEVNNVSEINTDADDMITDNTTDDINNTITTEDDMSTDSSDYDSNDSDTSDADSSDLADSSVPSFNHQFSIALLSIMDKHSLSYSSVNDLIKLFSFSQPNFLSSSLHLLLKKFANFEDNTRLHHCCGFCTKLLKGNLSCIMPECQAQQLPVSSFIEVRLDRQLQVLFSGKVMKIRC